MAFADNPLWEDSLSYSGLVIRRQDAMMLQADGTAGGAVPGIRPGDIGLAVSLAGSTITVTAGVASLFKAGFGVYRVSNPSSWTGTLTAANATNPRIDLVYVRVWDNAEDSSGLFKADVVYLTGTAAPSPVAPTPGSTEIYIPLATISVPQSGGGSPSVSTTVRAITVAPGGISPNAAQAGTYAGQYRDGATLQRYNGSAWEDKVYLAAGGQVNVGGTSTAASVASVLAATTSLLAAARVSGDANDRFTARADGTLSWGGGSTAVDTFLYRNAAGQLKTDGSLVAANGLSVSAGVGSRRTFVKPSDTSRASNTTASNDAFFVSMALEANATYAIDGYLQYQGSSTGAGDMKIQWTGPAGWTMAYNSGAITTGGVTTYDGTVATGGAVRSIGTGGGVDMAAHILGTITTSSTAGSLALQWAQNTSSATATILRAGSWLRLERVA